MAFSNKAKRRGSGLSHFKTAGNKTVLRAFKRDGLKYKSANYNIFMEYSVHDLPLITDSINLCLNCLSPHNRRVDIQYI
jgi:hypothetical protein